MSIQLGVTIHGAKEMSEAFEKAPKEMEKNVQKAIVAGIFEIDKRAVDDNFQFKTPRSQRTGWLQASFAFGVKVGPSQTQLNNLNIRSFPHGVLKASIGPTANYAERVHMNNRFLPRIRNAATPATQKHFSDALEMTKRFVESKTL